ncbi:hypothetical protein E4T47_02994 [Aureobasidium subglaciale]|nr:hypothetical protein E4T47_02994 [Aureobasidium subglaciale]
MTTAKYPHFADLHNNDLLSDIKICSGDIEIAAHKVILMGASKVFYTAFTSQIPLTDPNKYVIEGHSEAVIRMMLDHIYERTFRLDSTVPMAEQIENLLDVFFIANEYEVLFLGNEIATIVADHLQNSIYNDLDDF